MNRRRLFKLLAVAPVAAAAAPLLPKAAGTIWARLKLRDNLTPALANTSEILDKIAAGVGIPRKILTADLGDRYAETMRAALHAEGERVMAESKLMMPVLPPAHPMCRCVLVPEGAYAEIHEDVRTMRESLERDEIHGTYTVSYIDQEADDE